MKRYSFGRFLVDESNRAAFAMAQKLAALQPEGPQPVLFLGEGGCGKTHLLYAIVNRVRTANTHIGLAFVKASDFPEKARLLIQDPSPLEKASAAILLVDQLEEFSELVGDLEALVRLFLEYGHTVVLASNRHPSRLETLTPGLRELIGRGTTIEFLPQSSDTRLELLKRELRQESDAIIERQRLEIQELHALLERVGKQGNAPVQDAETTLQRDLEAEQSRRERLERELASAHTRNEDLLSELERQQARLANFEARQSAYEEQSQRLEALEAELAELRIERDALRTQVEGYQAIQEELARVTEQVNALEAERAETRERAAATDTLEIKVRELEASLSAERTHAEEMAKSLDELEALREKARAAEAAQQRVAALEAEAASLRTQLEEARTESQAARDEANAVIERAGHLLELVEANKARFREIEAKRAAQIAALEDELARRGTAGPHDASEVNALKARVAALGEQLEEREQELEDFRGELAEAQAVCEQYRERQAALEDDNNLLRGQLEQAGARCEALEEALQETEYALEASDSGREEARQDIEALREELEVLRREAATQVAAAHAQAGELERRLKTLFTAPGQAQRYVTEAGKELGIHAQTLLSLAEALTRTADRLETYGTHSDRNESDESDEFAGLEMVSRSEWQEAKPMEAPIWAPVTLDLSEESPNYAETPSDAAPAEGAGVRNSGAPWRKNLTRAEAWPGDQPGVPYRCEPEHAPGYYYDSN